MLRRFFPALMLCLVGCGDPCVNVSVLVTNESSVPATVSVPYTISPAPVGDAASGIIVDAVEMHPGGTLRTMSALCLPVASKASLTFSVTPEVYSDLAYPGALSDARVTAGERMESITCKGVISGDRERTFTSICEAVMR